MQKSRIRQKQKAYELIKKTRNKETKEEKWAREREKYIWEDKVRKKKYAEDEKLKANQKCRDEERIPF